MKRILSAAALVGLLLTGCAKDINNKEALHSALVDYYNTNQDKLGLNIAQMDVEIGSMSFQKDQAQATISIKPREGGEGMQLSKTFDRKGDKWVVRAGQGSGAAGHGTGQLAPSGALPPGHPTVGAPTGPRP